MRNQWIIFFGMFWIIGLAKAQMPAFNNPFKMEQGYYVVVGSFHLFENAQRFSDHIHNLGFPSKYGYSARTRFFYVYITFSGAYQEARAKCSDLQNKMLFKDAWVLNVVPEGMDGSMLADQGQPAERAAEYTSENIISPTGNNETREQTINPESAAKSQLPDAPVTGQTESDAVAESDRPDEIIEEDPEKAIEKVLKPDPLASGKAFNYYFSVIDARTFKEVPAMIQVIDPVRQKMIQQVEAHQNHLIRDPNNGGKTVQFISSSIGYKKVQFDLALDNPPKMEPTDKTWQKGDTTLIDFQVHRLEKGDIQIMFNVYFFNNSAIMRPESQFELLQLLTMMNDNSNYEIRIHGHTNGNANGPVIKMEDKDVNFFELSSSNSESNGSAKQLSKERADVIKRYLVYKGVEDKRMKVKGWGGKKMIYTLNHPDAHRNARVEIEILKD